MISVKKYLKDPCNSLSMPYWKAKKTSLRSDTIIVHQTKYDEVLYREWHDTLYFRIQHDLLNLTSRKLSDNFFYKTVDEEQINDVVTVVNQSNEEQEITKNDVIHWMREETYCKDLWILVYSKRNYKYDKINKVKIYMPVAVVISNFDKSTKEASFELLHVIPTYRKNGLATSLIKESLLRISCIADFATVTGKVETPENIYDLYKKCGFTGDAIWHVLRKK